MATRTSSSRTAAPAPAKKASAPVAPEASSRPARAAAKKTTAQPATQPAPKTAPKAAAKAVTKAPTKSVAKPAAKSSAQAPAKVPAKTPAKTPVKAKATAKSATAAPQVSTPAPAPTTAKAPAKAAAPKTTKASKTAQPVAVVAAKTAPAKSASKAAPKKASAPSPSVQANAAPEVKAKAAPPAKTAPKKTAAKASAEAATPAPAPAPVVAAPPAAKSRKTTAAAKAAVTVAAVDEVAAVAPKAAAKKSPAKPAPTVSDTAAPAGLSPMEKVIAAPTGNRRRTAAERAETSVDASAIAEPTQAVEAVEPAPAHAEPAAELAAEAATVETPAAQAPAEAQREPRSRRRGGRGNRQQADRTAPSDKPADNSTDDLPNADVAASEAPSDIAEPAPAAPPAAPDLRPQHSALELADGLSAGLVWLPGKGCPADLDEAICARLDEQGLLPFEADDALPMLQRLAANHRHELRLPPSLWLQLAWHRDARQRLAALVRAYPQGPGSPALLGVLNSPLAPYQAEGALLAVCAGRALINDEPGLGKGVQAIATAQLMRRHVGTERVLVLCGEAARINWQREWLRFAGAAALADTRFVSTQGLDAAGVAALNAWSADLVIIDEPQRQPSTVWTQLQSRHALVLCGAPLNGHSPLLNTIVQFLEHPRRGADWRWAWHPQQDLDQALATLMVRRRSEVREQLPAQVLYARQVLLAPAQRQAHDALAQRVQAQLARWRRTGLLPDLDQWQVDADLNAMQALCHREHPEAPLAQATLDTLSALIDELLPPVGPAESNLAQRQVAVVLPTLADAQAIADRLGQRTGLSLVESAHDAPHEAGTLVHIGVPWRPAQRPHGGGAAQGRRCFHLVAQGALDSGLYDTLDLRRDAPRGVADGSRGFLSGSALTQYLLAAEAALAAMAQV